MLLGIENNQNFIWLFIYFTEYFSIIEIKKYDVRVFIGFERSSQFITDYEMTLAKTTFDNFATSNGKGTCYLNNFRRFNNNIKLWGIKASLSPLKSCDEWQGAKYVLWEGI